MLVDPGTQSLFSSCADKRLLMNYAIISLLATALLTPLCPAAAGNAEEQPPPAPDQQGSSPPPPSPSTPTHTTSQDVEGGEQNGVLPPGSDLDDITRPRTREDTVREIFRDRRIK